MDSAADAHAFMPAGGEAAVYGTMPTDEQQAIIQILRDTIQETEEYALHKAEAEAYINDNSVLHRFLCARKYDEKKAGDMLRKHILWRFGIYRPFDICCEEVKPHARTGKPLS